LIAACAIVDTIDPRYDTINRSAANARNESILLNIVRASQNAPLNFIAFSRVSGASQAGVGVSPQIQRIENDYFLTNVGINTSANINNSFDISILESKDFYTALLSPIDLPTLNFFLRQGYTRELLFWLFTDAVRETALGHTIEYRNVPSLEKSCEFAYGRARCFRDMVDVAIASGLTVETRVAPNTGAGAGKVAIRARLCFDPVLAARARREYAPEVSAQLLAPPSGHHPICRRDPWPQDKKGAGPADTDLLNFYLTGTPVGPVHYEIITRSTFGVYQFLGRILAENATDLIAMRGPLDSHEDNRILAIQRGAADCFVAISFVTESYCVPQRGAENTKRIFSLLAQLLALKTQAGDLAITPTVRVAP
jgi:hypothetical protein